MQLELARVGLNGLQWENIDLEILNMIGKTDSTSEIAVLCTVQVPNVRSHELYKGTLDDLDPETI